MGLAPAQEQLEALVGQTIGGKYRVERLVGAGGMGAVYEAQNLSINKRVALKFLLQGEVLGTDRAARFQREAEAASAVDSAHIVQIYDAGMSDDGRPYLVMELLDGEDLRRWLKRERKLPLPAALHIVGQLLRALGRAHQAGIVHRDLKPDNVFICNRDDDPLFVKVVDFGISKVVNKHLDTLTRRGTVLGTAHYMAPEQAQAFPDIDGRADLFSVGAILYEALAGRPPHVANSYEAVLIKACTTSADDIRNHAPEVPSALAAVIAKSIERDRADRYQTAHEFSQALEQAVPTEWSRLPALSSNPTLSLAGEPALADTKKLTRVESVQSSAPATRRYGALFAVVLVVASVALTVWATRNPGAVENNASSERPSVLPDLGSPPEPPGPSAPRASIREDGPPKSALKAPAAGRVHGSPLPSRPGSAARSSPPPPAVTSAEAPPPAPPAPGGSGVAGQLRLKTEGP